MYFYSIRPLKERLAAGPLPEAESFPYLVIFVAATAIASWLPGEFENVWDWTQMVLSVAVAVMGTWILYRANGGASGRDFLSRYVVLGWVVTVRFFTLVLPALIGFFLIAQATGLDSEATSMLDVGLAFFVEVSFLVYFGLHLDDLRQMTATYRDARFR